MLKRPPSRRPTEVVSRGFVGVGPTGRSLCPVPFLPAPGGVGSDCTDESGNGADDRERNSEVEPGGVRAVAPKHPVDAQEAETPTHKHEEPEPAGAGPARSGVRPRFTRLWCHCCPPMPKKCLSGTCLYFVIQVSICQVNLPQRGVRVGVFC